MDYHRYLVNAAVFYLTFSYITFLLKETKSGWNISSKYILYAATAITFIISGLFIGFTTTLGYIFFSVIIAVVCLPAIRMFLDKRRNH